ncbi:hypothetical protein TRFO_22007 [Tritrichomonas foetus]|uniref:non-specific serine/threonine protein kinase n=1 Tax=Tritrichomonas foetus TaxID=1144522 RepID=A0A1J4KDX0_9EUKA|nr:hypothetical protein TRFO_22007 [Tritrichomonas foetus]|eukprot:OHT09186.1 hypothetical protein TRFO_22007 [Tritrichomonas foetus]
MFRPLDCRDLKKIGKGSFCDVYFGKIGPSGVSAAIKKESNSASAPQLAHEALVMKTMNGSIGFPTFLFFNENRNEKTLAMNFLGKSLQELFEKCGKKFSLKTVLMIADQLLCRIEMLHNKGYVHRDIKPANFLIGRHEKANVIYVIDFGLSSNYLIVEKTREYNQPKNNSETHHDANENINFYHNISSANIVLNQKNQISNNQISNNQICNNQICNNQICNNQIGNNQISNNQISNNQIGNNQIRNNQIGNNQISNNQICNNQICNNQISNNQICNNQIGNNQPVNFNQSDANNYLDNVQQKNMKKKGISQVNSTQHFNYHLSNSPSNSQQRKSAPNHHIHPTFICNIDEKEEIKGLKLRTLQHEQSADNFTKTNSNPKCFHIPTNYNLSYETIPKYKIPKNDSIDKISHYIHPTTFNANINNQNLSDHLTVISEEVNGVDENPNRVNKNHHRTSNTDRNTTHSNDLIIDSIDSISDSEIEIFLRPVKKTHIQITHDNPVIGTTRFSSINSCLGNELSRRDDLESLAYLFIYFLKGSLPWERIKARDISDLLNQVVKLKQNMPIENLCDGIPEEFGIFLQKVRSLQFDEKPNYSEYRNLFKQCFMRLGFVYDYNFDWLDENKLTKEKKGEDHLVEVFIPNCHAPVMMKKSAANQLFLMQKESRRKKMATRCGVPFWKKSFL